jgi:hypothetical protein
MLYICLGGLQTFITLLASHSELRTKVDNQESGIDDDYEESGTRTPQRRVHIRDTHRVLQNRRRAMELEKQHSVSIEDMLPILREATAELRLAAAQATQAAKDTLFRVNTERYKRRLESLVPWRKN